MCSTPYKLWLDAAQEIPAAAGACRSTRIGIKMGLFHTFYPDDWVESAYAIDYEKLYKQGYRGVIFDIDNTLVEHGKDADERAVSFFKKLREIGFQSCLLSNNKEERVLRFNKMIQTKYIFDAHKPSRKNYRLAMERMGTTEKNTLFVGDQLFTDVWGAKRTGIRSILVRPIDRREEIQIVLKRFLEKPILWIYQKHKRE